MSALASWIRRLRYGRPIVVVSGLPRSGTSLMMQMLQAGGLEVVTDAVRAPDEGNPRGYFELEAVKDLEKGTHPAWLADARGKAVKIVSPLLRWLPSTHSYRVILMRRDLDEVIASQNGMLAARGFPQDETQNDRIRQRYEELEEQTLKLLGTRPCFSVLQIQYADAIARPEETARAVAAFVGRTLDVRRMAEVAEPGLYRNRIATPDSQFPTPEENTRASS